MKKLISNFPQQVREALTIGKAAGLSASNDTIANVFISGLGGSGIGGTIVSELVAFEAKVPINVGKTYFIPSYINEHSLVIISSYSGNTEETINALELALEKRAKIVCVTSGGKIQEIAKANKLDIILIPGGMPPRACLGYSMTQLFFILNYFQIIGKGFLSQLEQAIKLIEKDQDQIQKQAREIAEKLKNKIPVIYTTSHNEGIAIRFRQQINENSKMLCWHHVFPELNHNELVGWTEKNEKLAIVLFRDKEDYSRNQTRIEISKTIFEKYTDTITEVYSKGNSVIEKSIYLIHLGDWVSYFIAEIKGIDSIEVAVINHLKAELAKS